MRGLLGSGGMGEVWLAHDVRIDREIAIKLMRGAADPDAIARFLREAKVQGRLEHPSVVPVHDVGLDSNPYLAMKRLQGTTLHQVLDSHDPQWTRRALLTRFVDICLAVEFAHSRGVIHRDLKPANIMLGDFGETYVLDWGLARLTGDSSDGRPSLRMPPAQEGDSGAGQTQVGAVLGTPGYMPPEQMKGEIVDNRADVFSLGCILFEILTRTPAIAPDKAFEITLGTGAYHPMLRRPEADVPPELDKLVAEATAADRKERTATARTIADAVSRYLEGDRDKEHRRTLAAAHAAAAAAAAQRNDRALAMREAGRAIALHPENVDAQALLLRFMLDVPSPIPEAAMRSVHEERAATTRDWLRLGARAYLANTLFIPFGKLAGVEGWWPFLGSGALLVIQAMLCLYACRPERPVPITRTIYALFIINHVTLLAFTGLCFGSLLFTPLFAFGSLPIMLMLPQVFRPYLALGSHLVAIAIPVALDLTGVLGHSSFRFEGNMLVFVPWAVSVSGRAIVGCMLAVIAAQMWVNTRVLSGGRRATDRATEQVHLQRWQLEQLVRTE
ncbi:MAG: serine/threonine-protein kinase [Kofleriaceae bacterium]